MSTTRLSALAALTASALAIPVGGASAQEAAKAATDVAGAPLDLSYRYSSYRESSLPADKTAGSQRERYKVDSHYVRAAKLLGNGIDLSADLAIETMSGASPWFITPGPNGRPLQVMSGASIDDERTALRLRAGKTIGSYDGALNLSFSRENDYRSNGIAFEIGRAFNNQLDTLSASLAYTDNKLEPTDGGSAQFPTRITRADNDEVALSVGYTRVLSENAQIQTTLTYSWLDGYLSDPYKLAYVAGNLLQDARPDGREELAWLTRLRYYVPAAGAALHLDYRYFRSDWQTRAHTVEAAWYQPLPHGWQLVPRVRWYSQSQAYFYEPYYNTPRADFFQSSDYRLSPYGALSFSLEASKVFDGWRLSARFENYESDGRYAVGNVKTENPGLVDFRVFSVGIAKSF